MTIRTPASVVAATATLALVAASMLVSSSVLSAAPSFAATSTPKTRVDVTCSQLQSVKRLDAAFGEKLRHQPWAQDPWDHFNSIQQGGLTCGWWDSPVGQYYEDFNSFEITVAPDVPLKTWKAWIKRTHATTPAGYKSNVVGSCGMNTRLKDGASCGMDVRIGTTWVDFAGYAGDATFPSRAAGDAAFHALISHATEAIEAAKISEPRWTNPNATALNLYHGVPLPSTAVSKAVGQKTTLSTYVTGRDAQPSYFVDHTVGFVDRSWRLPKLPADMWLEIRESKASSWFWSTEVAKAKHLAHFTKITGLGVPAFSFAVTRGGVGPIVDLYGVSGTTVFDVELQPGYDTSTTTRAIELADAKAVAKALITRLG